MHAIILAGGFGTRLQSVLDEETPKPMAPINGEPFLAHYIRFLRAQGVTDVMLSVHHKRDAIMRYFGSRFEATRITYAIEETPLGTGGAVKYALSLLPTDEPVLVVNGDSFVELDVIGMMRAHRAGGSTLTIALHEMPDCSRYGEVLFDAKHRITDFKYPGSAEKGWISTGCYVVSPNIFSGYNLPESFSFEKDFQQPFASVVRPTAWLTHGYFIDIGVPADYARAQAELSDIIEAREAA